MCNTTRVYANHHHVDAHVDDDHDEARWLISHDRLSEISQTTDRLFTSFSHVPYVL
jgi:hypothetical protein